MAYVLMHKSSNYLADLLLDESSGQLIQQTESIWEAKRFETEDDADAFRKKLGWPADWLLVPLPTVTSSAGSAEPEFFYDDGNWHAGSTGFFISLLVDAGQDPAIAWRVLENGPVDADGQFIRRLEAVIIPNGHVREELQALPVKTVHKVLAAFIEKGIVK